MNARQATRVDVLDRPEPSFEVALAQVQANPVALFTDEAEYSSFYTKIEAEVSGHPIDLTTDKGRKAIAALAFRVTKAKTTLDKAGLSLTEEWRKQTAAVTASRKKMTAELDQLATRVRAPLTQWEVAEAARIARVETELARFRSAASVGFEETAASVEERGRSLHAELLDADLYEERLADAVEAKGAAVKVLAQAMHRLRKEEADKVELERLREEARQRAERDAEEQRQRDAAAAEQRAKDEAEKAEREAEARRESEIAAAEDRARRAEQDRVEKEARDREAAARRLHEAALETERKRAVAAEREAAEVRRKEQERLAWEQRERRETEAREADEQHRKAVIAEVAADIGDILEDGISTKDARRLADAIAAGTVRNISVRF